MKKLLCTGLFALILLALSGCNVDWTFKVPGPDLIVTVKDVDGNPVAGAEVRIGVEGEKVIADAQGKATLSPVFYDTRNRTVLNVFASGMYGSWVELTAEQMTQESIDWDFVYKPLSF